jgi:hypothetical protein
MRLGKVSRDACAGVFFWWLSYLFFVPPRIGLIKNGWEKRAAQQEPALDGSSYR